MCWGARRREEAVLARRGPRNGVRSRKHRPRKIGGGTGETPSTPASRARFHETQIKDDHRLEHDTYPVLKLVDGQIKRVDEAGADRAQHALARRL